MYDKLMNSTKSQNYFPKFYFCFFHSNCVF